MDEYSIKKRSQDKLLALGLDMQVGPRLQTLQDKRTELLRGQASTAKDLRTKLGNHIMTQTTNQIALQRHIDRDKGPFAKCQSGHIHPPVEEHRSVHQQVQALGRTSTDINALLPEHRKLCSTGTMMHQELVSGAKPSVNSMSAWFAKYGEPKRESQQLDLHRSYIMKPRWRPELGCFSHVQTLRKGKIIL